MELSTFVITAKGQALMAKILQGTCTGEFTAVKLSSTAYTQEQLEALTALTNVKQTAAITRNEIVSNTHIQIEAACDNTSIRTGYTINTIGLYATDPDEGEILYAVSRATTAGYMPAYNFITVSGASFKFVISVGNSSAVTVVVDPAGYASMNDIVRLEGDIEDINTNIDEVKAYIGMVDDEIYGVEVDFINRTFKRLGGAVGKTGGSDFDDIDPWKRKRCIVTDDGVILDYYFNGNVEWTESGALTRSITIGEDESAVTYPVGTKVQVMVYQPKFYYKVVPIVTDKIQNGKGSHLRKARYYISPVMRAGFKLHPAFKYNGIEQEYILLSAYEGSLYDVSASAYISNDDQVADFTVSTGDQLSSINNAKPCSGLTQNLTRANARILASNRGDGWMLQDVNKVSASQLLFLIEYASFNSQNKIGAGHTTTTDDGASNMSYKTGITEDYGDKSGQYVLVNRTTGVEECLGVTYRGEENLWGNIWKWIDGINIKSLGDSLPQDLFIADHGFAESTYSGAYVDAGFSVAAVNGYVNAMGYSEEYDYLFIPSETGNGANSSLPVGDNFWCNSATAGDRVAWLGASWYSGLTAGLFYWAVGNAPSHRTRYIGGRLAYVPKTA